MGPWVRSVIKGGAVKKPRRKATFRSSARRPVTKTQASVGNVAKAVGPADANKVAGADKTPPKERTPEATKSQPKKGEPEAVRQQECQRLDDHFVCSRDRFLGTRALGLSVCSFEGCSQALIFRTS